MELYFLEKSDVLHMKMCIFETFLMFCVMKTPEYPHEGAFSC